jgi:hypothetical protein
MLSKLIFLSILVVVLIALKQICIKLDKIKNWNYVWYKRNI